MGRLFAERIKIVHESSHASIPHLPALGGCLKNRQILKARGKPY